MYIYNGIYDFGESIFQKISDTILKLNIIIKNWLTKQFTFYFSYTEQ